MLDHRRLNHLARTAQLNNARNKVGRDDLDRMRWEGHAIMINNQTKSNEIRS